MTSQLGPIAMPILARIQPVDLVATKSVFISAIRFATSVDSPCPPFGDELRSSAQEQVEYMLGDDKDIPLVAVDKDVKSETRTGLSQTFLSFERELSSLLESDSCKMTEAKIVQSLSDLEWMCNILLKMGLMDDFVSKWIDISENVLQIIEDKKLECNMWGLKLKLVEVTSKVVDAVGYGSVILPPQCRVQLLKTWLPYIRKLKPVLDSLTNKDAEFRYKMDEDLWQSIEGAMVSLVSALPSDDQADILADWMNTEQRRYPDLSEVFEIWCFRTKSAKRSYPIASHTMIFNTTAVLVLVVAKFPNMHKSSYLWNQWRSMTMSFTYRFASSSSVFFLSVQRTQTSYLLCLGQEVSMINPSLLSNVVLNTQLW